MKIRDRCLADLPIVDWHKLPRMVGEVPAAELLGVSISFLRKGRVNGAKAGQTPPPRFVMIGGRRLYRITDLLEWVESLESHIAI